MPPLRSRLLVCAVAACACAEPTATRHLVTQAGSPNQKIIPSTYVLTILPLLRGGVWSEGTGISDTDIVSGFGDFAVPCSPFYHVTSAALWSGGVVKNIGVKNPHNNPAACFYQPSYALDVNRSGHAAGTMVHGADFYAFFWNGTAMLDIGGGPDSRAHGINATDVVVGYWNPHPISGGNQAFKWTAAGGLVDIHPKGWHVSRALDINDGGDIVGRAIHFGGGSWETVLWSRTGTFTSTGLATSAEWSWYLPGGIPAAGINAKAVIAASIPSGSFHTWYRKSPSGLPVFLPDTPAVATDISARLRIVGYRRAPSIGPPPTVAAATLGGYTELLPGTSPSWAAAVNTCGSIAGTIAGRSPTSRAALWKRAVCD